MALHQVLLLVTASLATLASGAPHDHNGVHDDPYGNIQRPKRTMVWWWGVVLHTKCVSRDLKRTCAHHAYPYSTTTCRASTISLTHLLYQLPSPNCRVPTWVPYPKGANFTRRLVHIGNKTYAACDTYRDCAEMSGGRLVNECFSRTLPNGTGATAKVAICSCMGFAGFIPQIDEEPCWEARCNVGTKTCLTRHVEGYFNLVSAGRGGRWCIVAENATLEWQEPACSSLKNRHLYASTHIREHFLLILSLTHTTHFN